ncbi:ent-kaurene oxidase [Colletotrichum costaricense]|uniref:Ent-kaurene oxidase n=1 Tax=Colletotrichum costaricense TaxID=1209916 RepID=A0AAJ0E1B4_9PEZI|nr:ent-kaurene oxidase [Colletotrichum costaricense]KAK1527088.1 ent-kaurene oxidase [Colletotrichum costaricense]
MSLSWSSWLATLEPQQSALGLLFVVLSLTLAYVSIPGRHDHLPYINRPPKWDFLGQKTKQHFVSNARSLMANAREAFKGKPYRMFTDLGDLIVIPAHHADEMRNERSLDFLEAFVDNFHPDIPGFEGFTFDGRKDQLLHKTINKKITKMLNEITAPLSLEADFATRLILGISTGWREIPLQEALLNLVARLSSRVFLGDELCRNDAWIKITGSYSINTFSSAEVLRQYPHYLRHIACYFIPQCRLLREQVAEARRVLNPVLEKREWEKKTALAEGRTEPSYKDAIQWVMEEAQGSTFDPVGAQLGLSVVAIHTTTDLATETMLRLMVRPQLMEDVRAEIVAVLRKEGWTKSALFNMKLLDSVIKEAQRLKPTTSATMNRKATSQVKLPGGLVLEKGDRCMADLGSMVDPNVYPDPLEFDGYRFFRMRGDPKMDSKAHLVSTSVSHMGFGHGLHACPGRFFASNEVKVLLCHLLHKYDWKLDSGFEHTIHEFGLSLSSGSTKAFVARRQNVEIDIDAW